MDYGLTEFKELLEKRYKDCDDPMNIPFGCDPFSDQSKFRRQIQKQTYQDVLEQFPDSIGISRHSKRLIEELRARVDNLESQLALAEAERGY